jgi:hypothetical protein
VLVNGFAGVYCVCAYLNGQGDLAYPAAAENFAVATSLIPVVKRLIWKTSLTKRLQSLHLLLKQLLY